MRTLAALLPVVLAALFILRCTDNPTESNNGGGVETGNALIQGTLYVAGGNVAAHATVTFIPVSQDPTGSSDNLITITATTDEQGVFGINTALSGNYNVFGDNELGKLSFADSIVLTGDSAVLPPDTLKAAGGLKIVFKVQPQHDPRLIDLIFWGTDLGWVPVAQSGLVEINNLAQGTYPVRIKLSTEYAVIDTHVSVTAGQITDLDTIELRYLNVPVVTGLALAYDTLHEHVVLSWNKIDTGLISGYNVYRGETGATFYDTPINASIITDTNYIDSFVPSDNRQLIYRIKAVNKNGDVGSIYSAADTIIAVPQSYVSTTFEWTTLNVRLDTIGTDTLDHFYQTASIMDTVIFVVRYSNEHRNNVTISWYSDSIGGTLIKEHAVASQEGFDTLRMFWADSGVKHVYVQAEDAGGGIWTDGFRLYITLDPPSVNIGNDMSVLPGATVDLQGSAYDKYGEIVKWEWDIGLTGVFIEATNEYSVLVPPTETYSFKTALRVMDDDANFGYDTMNMVIYQERPGEFSPDSSTVGLWHLNEGSGKIVYDRSSNNNQGQVRCGTWDTGLIEFGLRDSGNYKAMTVDTSSSLIYSGSGGWTVELWFYSDTIPLNDPFLVTQNAFCGIGISSTTVPYRLHKINWYVYLDDGSIQRVFDDVDVVPQRTWMYVAGVYDGTRLMLYVNGQKKGEVSVTGVLKTGAGGDMALGSDGRYFPGVFDEVRISSAARTESEILNCYNLAKP